MFIINPWKPRATRWKSSELDLTILFCESFQMCGRKRSLNKLIWTTWQFWKNTFTFWTTAIGNIIGNLDKCFCIFGQTQPVVVSQSSCFLRERSRKPSLNQSIHQQPLRGLCSSASNSCRSLQSTIVAVHPTVVSSFKSFTSDVLCQPIKLSNSLISVL